MAIPKFDEFFLPVMQDLKEHSPSFVRELIPRVAASVGLTEAEKAEMLPSGTQPTYRNRIHWALAYLKKAGLVASPSHGCYEILEKGREMLQNSPDEITLSKVKELMGEKPGPAQEPDNITPQERMDQAYKVIREELSGNLLQNIMNCSPAFFERLVVQLLIAMGYGDGSNEAGMVVGQSGDGGIDGIINEDKLGFSQVYIQAKRWDTPHTVGSPEIQAFVGALLGKGSQKGLFITTSHFSKAAKQYAMDQKAARVILIDGDELTRLMIDYGVGVSIHQTYIIRQIDTDYFEE